MVKYFKIISMVKKVMWEPAAITTITCAEQAGKAKCLRQTLKAFGSAKPFRTWWRSFQMLSINTSLRLSGEIRDSDDRQSSGTETYLSELGAMKHHAFRIDRLADVRLLVYTMSPAGLLKLKSPRPMTVAAV